MTDRPVFSDVIKVRDGVFINYGLHAERIKNTSAYFFGKELSLELAPDDIPAELRSGTVKCRIEYSDEIRAVTFTPYKFKKIESVALVRDNAVEYPFKSTDRSALNNLLSASGCDEIIIVKNGYLTDTSFSNLVLKNSSGFYTPDTCLLPGTQREFLLSRGIVKSCPVSPADLPCFDEVYFINAMIDLSDNLSVPVKSILPL